MLIEFTTGNILSFRDRVTLSLEAAAISEPNKAKPIEIDRYKLLRGAVVYGANSSGKSNLIKAMATMRKLITTSSNLSSVSELGVTPFLLSTITENQPSHFEIVFLLDGLCYRYGFEVDNRMVHAEWLFEAKTRKGAEYELFTRERDNIVVSNRFKEAKKLEEKTRDNALFLSVVDQFAGELAGRIMRWFANFVVVSGLDHEVYEIITWMMLEKEETRERMVEFYQSLDLGFQGIVMSKKLFDPSELPKDIPEERAKTLIKELEGGTTRNVRTRHSKFNEENKAVGEVLFNMEERESTGTKKIFNLSGPIFDVLNDGGVLAVDEIDASIHANLMLAIVRLFRSSQTNPYNAQLIITTHDTNLLTYGDYRRDQVYFVEKDPYEASDLYSLVEYKHENGKSIRNDESFEKNYIQGRYGAIPFIGNPAKVIRKWQRKE